MDNELLLFDRLNVIRDTITKYGEENFCISFSGGKDSTVLHYLVDMALPNNKIPRVYANTGIELKHISDFVEMMAGKDKRFEIIKPSKPIKKVLEEEGYPFKSKTHSRWVYLYQKNGLTNSVKNYIEEGTKELYRPCPDILKYQFSEQFKLKISDKCCLNLKEKPIEQWQKEHGKPYGIVGIMREEGGRRMNAVCLAFKNQKLVHFQPLAVVTKEWEEWFIKRHSIELCDLYYDPYNFERTGCKGCPFTQNLQHELEVLEKYFPNERKQCEYIWKPVYDEYRRIGYRLKKDEQLKLL